MKKILLTILTATSSLINCQIKVASKNWFNLDPKSDSFFGVSTEKSYTELLKNKKSKTIVVAVLDSGVDVDHEDLKDVIWVNPGEIPGNLVDDDHNGYVDDIHGWNFIGAKDGRNIEFDNLEMTRLLRKFNPAYEGKSLLDFTDKSKKREFELFMQVKKDFTENFENCRNSHDKLHDLKNRFTELDSNAKKYLMVQKVKLHDLENYSPINASEMRAKSEALWYLKSGQYETLEDLLLSIQEGYNYYDSYLKYSLNLNYDPRHIVGDDYSNSYERYYGNPDCKGPDSFHGTHVAGIIAAKRGNGIGIDGIADNVRIMSIRCVPNGDERDKDVANAILYAAENGAKIINMSFGKKYAWDKEVVDKAIRYAESKGVLIIHASGNDHLNVDSVPQFPSKKYAGKGEAGNFLNIGAISWQTKEIKMAGFSNYGKHSVDLLAPGVDIYSTAPENKYQTASGTSMAAPVVSGVAAVLMEYFPDLKPKEIKRIIQKSSIKSESKSKVIKPGTTDCQVELSQLCKNGGIVNLYEAIRLANKLSKLKT